MEIVKRKRTKRSRPYSPICGGATGDATCFPELSDEISMSTEEEEDMANCLILLAQGFSPMQGRENDEDEYSRSESRSEKTTCKKRVVEIDAIETGRNGFYIYECKTCNRTFPSFQALGGHRASHKKQRADQKDDKEVKAEDVKGQYGHFAPSQQVLVAAVKPAFSPVTIKASKVHECSICGSEFSSGQALGGHMRRHRTVLQVKATGEPETEIPDNKTINILSFDLNLPPPIDDDQNQVMESAFGFRPKNHLVFSGPALVGCHY